MIKKYNLYVFLFINFCSVFAQTQTDIEKILFKGEDYYKNGNYQEAIMQFNECVSGLKKSTNSPLLGRVYNNLGNTYSQIGKSEAALSNYLLSLDISKQTNDSLSLSKTYKNIGTLYEEQRDFEKAMEYYNRSFEIAKIKNDLYLMADCHNNMGIVYEQKGDYKKALELYSNALKIYKIKGDEQRISMVFNNLAIVHKYLKNYPEAIKNYKAALILSEKLGDQFMLAANQTNLGNVYALTGDYKKSLEMCSLANENAKAIDAKEIIIESYEGISIAYEKLHQFQEAVKYRKLYEQEKESFINLERANLLAEMQIKFEVQKKETEIELLNQESKIKEFKIKEQATILIKKNYQIIAFLISFFGLFIISYFWWKNQKLKNTVANEKIIKETEEHERIRIAKDIHDDLGSGLTKINFLSEIISQKAANSSEIRNNSEVVKETSKRMIENMRDLIWALNPENTTIANFLARMREYSTDYLEDYPIEIFNNFPENPPQTPIFKEAHRELFMIVKEALNNIVKHSNASAVNFAVKLDTDFLEFSIQDNGTGFNLEQIKNGNGLKNMKTRLQTLEGTCIVVTKPNEGTKIEIKVSLLKLIKR